MLRKTKQQLAHTSMMPALGNRDVKALQDVIISEKTFIKHNGYAAQSWHANGEALKTWGEGEGEELTDVLSKLSLLFDHYTAAQERFNSHLATIRLHFKSVRTREEGLAELKSKKRALTSRIENVEKKLAKMGPENKELMKTTSTLKELKAEMQSISSEVVTEELALGDFKRRTAREAMGLKCGGLLELAEKSTIVAEIGKMMIDEIPLDVTSPGVPRPHYSGHARTEQLLSEAGRHLSQVGFGPSGQSTGFESTNLHQADDSIDQSAMEETQHDLEKSGQQQPEDTSGNTDDAYTGGGGTYSAAADYSSTPIYASHQTTRPWMQEQDTRSFQSAQQGETTPPVEVPASKAVHTENLHDRTADDWARSADAANGAGTVSESQVDGRGSQDGPINAPGRPWVNPDSTGGHGSPRRLSPARGASAVTHQAASSVEYSSGAPSLPPLRVASPIASAPSAGIGEPDEDPYFAAVGSTRAIQAAARRPTSPGIPNNPANRYAGGPASSFGAAVTGGEQTPTATSSRYEPPDSGRKMTAAAFRKGFNRNPSGTHHPGLPPTPTSEYPTGVPDRQSTASPAVEPLAIRKRHSAVHDVEVPDHEVVPPYVPGQSTSHASGSQDEAYQQQSLQPYSSSNGYADPNYHISSQYDASPSPQRERYHSAYGGVDGNDEYTRSTSAQQVNSQQSYQNHYDQAAQPTSQQQHQHQNQQYGPQGTYTTPHYDSREG